jgi:hypothetical protein
VVDAFMPRHSLVTGAVLLKMGQGSDFQNHLFQSSDALSFSEVPVSLRPSSISYSPEAPNTYLATSSGGAVAGGQTLGSIQDVIAVDAAVEQQLRPECPRD